MRKLGKGPLPVFTSFLTSLSRRDWQNVGKFVDLGVSDMCHGWCTKRDRRTLGTGLEVRPLFPLGTHTRGRHDPSHCNRSNTARECFFSPPPVKLGIDTIPVTQCRVIASPRDSLRTRHFPSLHPLVQSRHTTGRFSHISIT